MTQGTTTTPLARQGTGWEVLRVFAKLGVTSFGGPIAHLGYFRDELIQRRKWLDDTEYGDLVALSQFLPGPASNQVGFGLGLFRAGPLGAIVAFLAFTLPSAALMVAFAYGAPLFEGVVGGGILSGLKIVAVAAALYDPVFTTAITGARPLVLALICFVLLIVWRIPAWAVVVIGAGGGVLLALAS